MSPSAVSQQIGRTEARIGQQVFERTSSGLHLTAFGREFTARLSAGFRELESAVTMAERAKACVLAVSVAPAFASKWLLPRLSRHFTRHPGSHPAHRRLDQAGRPRSLRHRHRHPHGRRQLARRKGRAFDCPGDFSGLRAGDGRRAENTRRSGVHLGDCRREFDVFLGPVVQGRRRRAGQDAARRALH